MGSESKITTKDGANLSVHDSGPTGQSGLPVLLISGLGGTAGFWKPVVEHCQTRLRLIRFDQRGIGASQRGQAAVSIRQLAKDSLDVLDTLEIEACHVIGHSTGGCIAQELAALAPHRIKGLVLSATWLKADPYILALFAHRRALLTENPEAYAGLGAIMGYAPQWLSAHWPVYEAAMRQVPDSAGAQTIIRERIDALLAYDGSAVIRTLACPTLVIGSTDDAIIPFTQQQILHQALCAHAPVGPVRALHGFDQGGHFFPVSRTQDFCSVITQWHEARA